MKKSILDKEIKKKLKKIISLMSADGLNDGLEWEFDSVYVTREEWEILAFEKLIAILEKERKRILLETLVGINKLPPHYLNNTVLKGRWLGDIEKLIKTEMEKEIYDKEY